MIRVLAETNPALPPYALAAYAEGCQDVTAWRWCEPVSVDDLIGLRRQIDVAIRDAWERSCAESGPLPEKSTPAIYESDLSGVIRV